MKAILVVYVPEDYIEQLDRLSIDYTLFYHDENGTVKPVDVESRCPLKPLPEKAKYTFKKNINVVGHMQRLECLYR